MFADTNELGVVDVGDTLVFTITITNESPTVGLVVDVLDMLPIGLADLDYIIYPIGADITNSNAMTLDVRDIALPVGSTQVIVFTAVITADAVDGEIIENIACCDIDQNGSADLCDPGYTPPIKNKETPPDLDDFCGLTYIIDTEAGTGVPGYYGNGVPAITARFYYPMQACVDQANNVYIADYSNHMVRRIDKLTGIITTVAGKPGPRGYSGDGGLAINAQLNFPSDVYVRGTNLYIAELGNSTIRKVDMLTGIITTVAGNGTEGYSGDGGPATLAQLYRPRGVYVDVAGNIYIADTFNFAMRMVDAATGIITTVMGNGIAGHAEDGDITTSTSIEWIHDIAQSSDGTIYFTEQNGYNLVRKIVDNKIYTVTGKGGNSPLGDCGYAKDAYLYKPYSIAFDTYDNLYIADEYNHKIRKIEALTEFIITVAGTGVPGYNGDGILGTSAMLNHPTGLAIGTDNILHIVDRYNQRIRWMDLEEPKKPTNFPDLDMGIIDTIAGTGVYGFNGDGPDARLVQLNYPGGITLDSMGNLIIADRSNHRVRKVFADWSILTIAGKMANRGYSGDGGQATDAQLNFPTDVALDATGNLYITDQYNHVVRRVAPNGIITTIAGNGTAGYNGDGIQATSAQLNYPDSVIVYGDILYISDSSNNRVRSVNLLTGVIDTVAGNGLTGQGAENVDAKTTPLAGPRGLAVASDGTLYIAAYGQGKVRKVDTLGIITTFAGSSLSGYAGDGGPATSAKLKQPADVALGPGGVLYIADYGNHRIRVVDALGIINTFAGTGVAGYFGDEGLATFAQLNYPIGVAVNSSGDLFISDRLNHAIRAVGH